jgi:hypothetical protein
MKAASTAPATAAAAAAVADFSEIFFQFTAIVLQRRSRHFRSLCAKSELNNNNKLNCPNMKQLRGGKKKQK